MRVKDLAKELGKNNNELIGYLKEKEISKTAMSNISADEEKMLREKFNNNIDGNKKLDNKEIMDNNRTVETTQEVSENKSGETPKKKVVVFRPQNAQQMSTKKSGSKSNSGAKKSTKKNDELDTQKQIVKKNTEEKIQPELPKDMELKKEEKAVEPIKTEEVAVVKTNIEEAAANVEETVSEPAKPRNVYAEMEAAKKAKENAKPIRNIFKEREERDKARGKDSRQQNRDRKSVV